MFKVINPGLMTTIQDGGRHGARKYGVPTGGAMDTFALRVANLLVGNAQFEAAIEMVMFGPELAATRDAVIAVTGADVSPKIGGKPVPMWQSIEVNKGETINFGAARNGFSAYLAVAGGFLGIPEVIGSRSTCLLGRFGGIEGRPIRKGDVLKLWEYPASPRRRALPAESVPKYTGEILVRAVPGPQDDLFTQKGIDTFFSSVYKVTPNSDRMGYRFAGPLIEHRGAADIVSDAVIPGTVQVPGDGRPIVMMADAQTTGGYPKIATVATADLSRLAQARPGSEVRFEAVTVDEATRLLREFEDNVAEIARLTR